MGPNAEKVFQLALKDLFARSVTAEKTTPILLLGSLLELSGYWR